jgi:predicted MPP superfamily phosphohydrolase
MDADHEALRARVGVYTYQLRMNLQSYHASQVVGLGRTLLHPENIHYLRAVMQGLLWPLGLYALGKRNARRFRVVEQPWQLRRLPDAFRGFRLLHLSDLHADLDPGIVDALVERLRPLDYDACVLTGDFRAQTYGDWAPAMRETARVVAALRGPVYGVLGNHDFLEFVPALEAMGVRMLVNERVELARGGEVIHLLGVDDPHFYETDNFERVLAGIPQCATKILLSHSAETYRKALASGCDLLLAGHTHGGQICLPGGIIPWLNAEHPRWMARGPWQYHDLQGYTSTGCGASVIPVRFFCPPQIVVHTLDRARLD